MGGGSYIEDPNPARIRSFDINSEETRSTMPNGCVDPTSDTNTLNVSKYVSAFLIAETFARKTFAISTILMQESLYCEIAGILLAKLLIAVVLKMTVCALCTSSSISVFNSTIRLVDYPIMKFYEIKQKRSTSFIMITYQLCIP